METINVIITAGGSSRRYGSENKLFEPCSTSCVLVEAIKPFLTFENVTKIIIALEPSYSEELLWWLDTKNIKDNRIVFTAGGKSRTETVKLGLDCIDDACDFVLIHDGARPYVTIKTIKEVIKGTRECGASLPLLSLTDALVSIEKGVFPKDRQNYRRVQTPAGFEKNRLVSAYNKCNIDFYDDISVVQTYQKGGVKIVKGDENNIKITTKDDLKTPLIGCGYDIHQLIGGQGIKLLGEFLECPYSFVAHSDGDVPVHAIMDAILSALGEKDIGHYFPVDDPAYDDADSLDLLDKVLSVMTQKGYKVSNMTVSIIAEKPMLSPHIDKMKENMSKILQIPTNRVGVSATTNEKVGDIGDGNAIAAYASVLLI